MGPLVPHALGPSRALSKLSSRETGKGGQFFLNPFHATPVLPLAHSVIRSAVIEVLDGWVGGDLQARVGDRTVSEPQTPWGRPGS